MNHIFNKNINSIISIILTLLISSPVISHASDHVDGQISLNNPVADITDLYAFPALINLAT